MASTVYPTGTTIYDPEKCWNGYNVFHPIMNAGPGATLMDMNGNIVNQWRGLDGFPNKMLPDGNIMGSIGTRNPRYGFQDQLNLIQVDWDGNIVWKFDGYEYIEDPGEKPMWMARQHHDYQREGNPVGYYAPGAEPLTNRGNTLLLCHKNIKDPRISDTLLLDDTIIEVTWDGKIVWEWICSQHFEEYGFTEEARKAIAANEGMQRDGDRAFDWMHINSISAVGPNRLYDAGDERFHPDNVIWDSRQSNIIAITDKKTGKIVWKVGPDYTATEELKKLGQIIGQHHAHMIPKGLPGEGNILVYDNGGWAGYGPPDINAPTGSENARRDYSRVLEFDPVTLEVVWQYTPAEAGFMIPLNAFFFYSGFISSAQRLPNGNTLITEGAGGRVFEVTREHEIVWEYINPYKGERNNMNMIYRAYRVPYEWAPRATRHEHRAIPRLDNARFRVPGSPRRKAKKVTKVDIKSRVFEDTQYCVIPEEQS